jgi:signal transduction histidine kinase
VRLEKTTNGICMCVTDTGLGFDLQRVNQSSDRGHPRMSGFGLKGMQDRAAVMGGTLTVDSRPGEGTAICLHIPGSNLKPEI